MFLSLDGAAHTREGRSARRPVGRTRQATVPAAAGTPEDIGCGWPRIQTVNDFAVTNHLTLAFAVYTLDMFAIRDKTARSRTAFKVALSVQSALSAVNLLGTSQSLP